jgi:hypothetical protein
MNDRLLHYLLQYLEAVAIGLLLVALVALLVWWFKRHKSMM